MRSDLKILAIASSYPYPPLHGGTLRIWNLLKNLPSSCKFDFLTFREQEGKVTQGELIHQLGASCDSIEFIPYSSFKPVRTRSQFSSIQNIYFPRGISIGRPYFSQSMVEKIKERIASETYDVVYMFDLYMALYIDMKGSRIPCIVDICDCMSLLKKTYFEQERRPLLKLRKYLDYIWANRYEKIHVSKIKNITMISEVDRQKLERNCSNSRIWVLPNGVDKEYFKRRSGVAKSTSELLFTGVMNYHPNNGAMLYFIKEVFPFIKKQIPGTILTVAGRDPTPELRSLAGEISGVRVTGTVEDLRPYFESATVYVSPLCEGAGMKNKVLEAWSMGVPVVASPVTCSGMLVRNDENILIAERPQEFAKKVIRVLKDVALRDRLTCAGLETVEREYSWSARGETLASICSDVIAKLR